MEGFEAEIQSGKQQKQQKAIGHVTLDDELRAVTSSFQKYNKTNTREGGF